MQERRGRRGWKIVNKSERAERETARGEEGAQGEEGEEVIPCSFIIKEKEMPQLELNNAPRRPTGEATVQIVSTA